MPLGTLILPPEQSSGQLIASSLGQIGGQVVGAATGVGGAGGLKPGKLSSMLGGASEQDQMDLYKKMYPDITEGESRALSQADPQLRNSILSNTFKNQQEQQKMEQQRSLLKLIFPDAEGMVSDAQAPEARKAPETPQERFNQMRDFQKSEGEKLQFEQQVQQQAQQQQQIQQPQQAQQQVQQAQQVQQQQAQQQQQRQNLTSPDHQNAVAANRKRMQQPPGITDNQIIAASVLNPELGKTLQNIRGREDKRIAQDRKEHWGVAKKVFEAVDEQAIPLPQKRAALSTIKDAIPKRGKIEQLGDSIADMTGIDKMRSASGAQLVTATKEFLLASLSRAGTRPNQWIEQQISKALTGLGYDNTSNAVIAELMEMALDIEEMYQPTLDQIAAEQEADPNKPYVKRNIGSELNRRMSSFADERQQEAISRIEEITGEKAPERTTSAGVPEGKMRIQLSDNSTAIVDDSKANRELAKEKQFKVLK